MDNFLKKFKAVLAKFGEPVQDEPEIETNDNFKDLPTVEAGSLPAGFESASHDQRGGQVAAEGIAGMESFQGGVGTAEAGAEMSHPDFVPGVEAQGDQYRGAGEVEPDDALNSVIERPQPGRDQFSSVSDRNMKDIPAAVGSARGPNFVAGENALSANPEQFRPVSPVEKLKAAFPHMAGEFAKMSEAEIKGLAERFVQKEKEKAEKAAAEQSRLQAVEARKRADAVKLEEARRNALDKAA